VQKLRSLPSDVKKSEASRKEMLLPRQTQFQNLDRSLRRNPYQDLDRNLYQNRDRLTKHQDHDQVPNRDPDLDHLRVRNLDPSRHPALHLSLHLVNATTTPSLRDIVHLPVDLLVGFASSIGMSAVRL